VRKKQPVTTISISLNNEMEVQQQLASTQTLPNNQTEIKK